MAEHTPNALLEELTDIRNVYSPESGQEVPWWGAILEGDFSRALGDVEQELNRTPDCAGTRLWWVRIQLELGRVPITALTSPLDEILSELEQMSPLYALSGSTFLKTAINLRMRNQSRLAVSMAERAVYFFRQHHTSSAEQTEALDEYFTSCLEEEIERAELRRENGNYVQSLKDKLKEHLKRQAAPEQESPRDEAAGKTRRGTRRKYLSSKSVMRLATEGEESDSDPKEDDPLQKKSSLAPLLLFTAIVLVIMATLGASWQLLFTSPKEESLPSRLAMQIQVALATNLELPDIREKRSSPDSTLAAVGKRLKQLGISQPPATDEPEADSSQNEAEKKTASAAKSPDELLPPDDEVVSIANLPPARNDIKQNRVPSATPPESIKKTEVEQISTTPRREPVPKDVAPDKLSVGPDGRVYGPPRTKDPITPSPGRKALDGSPLRSYEVVQYDPPLRYRTITATEVLSAPSLLANSLVRLEAGTPVDVTRRMGHWLELRSTAGRRGYIYAQDAEEDKR